ncbi:MAG: response regulator transcription factor, partial [Spirochaetales bacterium]|nr:response regulator transcription factor [Spirochaetales bacterium]
MPVILVAEDDDNLRLLITQRLKNIYEVIAVRNGDEALDVLSRDRIDLLVTDIMMPGTDGFQLVETVRKSGSPIPVLMLTANQSFEAKKQGFSLGTDDYLTKPFDKEELIWRIQALLRRYRIDQDNKIRVGSLVVNRESYTVSSGDRAVTLPRKEFELLYKLLSSPGRIFTKSQLMEAIWGYETESSEDTGKTHNSRIRNRLKGVEEIK